MGDLHGHFVLACDFDDIRDGKLKLFVPGEKKPRWVVPARGYGANGPGWKMTGGDTPPGRYRCGDIYQIPEDDPDVNAYGFYAVDLIDLDGQERDNNRAGIMIHGGGSSLPQPLAPKQGWVVTHGCVRLQNHAMLWVVNTILWARKQNSERTSWWTYDPRENYVDFTMQWVKDL